MTAKPPNMTTDAGIPVASDEYSLTLAPPPNLMRVLGTCSFPIRSRSGCSLRSRRYRKLGAHSHGEAVRRVLAMGQLTGPSADPRTSVGPTAAHT
jgi:hypothetical protein